MFAAREDRRNQLLYINTINADRVAADAVLSTKVWSHSFG